MFQPELLRLAEDVLDRAREQRLHIASAESCTGGLIGALLTEFPGSSDVFERGFIVYSNRAKTELLGVPDALIASHGAVSEEVARSLAEGVLAKAPVELAVSVTGVAGPGGGTAQKPVGLVHIGAIRAGHELIAERHVFPGDRDGIRRV